MALYLYCGLPGCGKTTLATALAVKFAKRGRYAHVYCNFPVSHERVETIPNEWLGTRLLQYAAVIVDEATLWADSRDYKAFDYARKQFILLHRHYHVDVYFFCQQFNALDIKIRRNIDRVYFLEKCHLFPFITRIRKVPYGMYIPDGQKETHKFFKRKEYGEIQEGYRLDRGFLATLLCRHFFRPRWYKYFDSFAAPSLPSIGKKEWETYNQGKRFEDFYPMRVERILAGDPNNEPAEQCRTNLEQ